MTVHAAIEKMGKLDPVSEQWKVIPEFPAYEASDCGEIRFTDSKLAVKQWISCGYCIVAVKREGQPPVHRRVHRLMLQAFVGPPTVDRPHTAHWDGVRAHNILKNLRWASPAENERDKIAHGRAPRGSQHPASKLTEAQVSEIRHSSESNGVLASRFGMDITSIRFIRCGKTWKYKEAGYDPKTQHHPKPRKRLSWDVVRVARQNYKDGMTITKIASEVGITRRNMQLIIHGDYWKEIA